MNILVGELDMRAGRAAACWAAPEAAWGGVRGQVPAVREVGRRRDLYTGKVIVVVTNEGEGER